MSLTLALALWGAILSSGLAVIQLVTWLAERPRLAIAMQTHLQRGAPPVISVTVTNRGRRPTTLVKVALRQEFTVDIDSDGRPLPGEHLESVVSDAPVLVDAGRLAAFTLPLDRWPENTFADEPLRAYVIDAQGRRAWGPAAPVLRLLLNGGWKPRGLDPRMLDSGLGEIKTPRVYPRWQVWKPTDYVFEPGTGRPLRRLGRFEV